MILIPIGAGAMTAAAGAGLAWPFLRSRSSTLQRLADPLEDERGRLLRALRELDHERLDGSLSEEDYAELRAQTERQAITVLRSLQGQERGQELAAALKAGKAGRRAGPPAGSRSRSAAIPGLLVAAAIVAVTVPLLFGALANRAAGGLITGNPLPPNGQSASALSFFDQRVQAHPDDIAARLDLAHQELAQGDVQSATDQYLHVVQRDQGNAEANTQLGFLLYQAQLPQEALAAVNRALQSEPQYPDALYAKGIILLGLHQSAGARAALQAYLQAAPFGSQRTQVQQLLAATGSSP